MVEGDAEMIVAVILFVLFAYWIGFLVGRILTLQEWSDAKR